MTAVNQWRSWRLALVSGWLLAGLPMRGVAQHIALPAGAALRPEATRAELQHVLDAYDHVDQPGMQGDPVARAVRDAVRVRLDQGDFRVGDRILLRVEGEQELSDTFVVGPGPALVLPGLGYVPVAGVLRSEIEEHLKAQLGTVLRNPEVHAQALLRISVQGEVVHPGYFDLPASAPLSDALMAAGGTTNSAFLARMRIERNGTPLITKEALARAIADGTTLDRANLRAGDQFVVPRRRTADETLRLFGILVTVPAAVYGMTRLF